ncbi:GntR family transcriptional regulator [Pseudomonas syringae pv. atrofaciens]|nr:GntR family transcriptional regulator [Pseudomonas syringae pv. atrofaciens]
MRAFFCACLRFCPVYNAPVPTPSSTCARVPMNDQSLPLKKQPRRLGLSRNVTQDDIVYEHVFDAILEQRLAPGTKLSEEALGEIFGVSRTIIRRALSRLGHEGVVLLRPNRGAVVASPSVEEARQVFFARRMVEKAITQLAVEHATAEQLAELRQMVSDERDSFARGDRGAGIRLSGEFHLQLAVAARNAPLISFQRSLVSQTSLIIAQYETGNRTHCSYDEHSQLIDAIEARNAALAVELMMHHMDHIDSKLNLDEDSASDDLHAVFSHVMGRKKTER